MAVFTIFKSLLDNFHLPLHEILRPYCHTNKNNRLNSFNNGKLLMPKIGAYPYTEISAGFSFVSLKDLT